MPSSEQIELTWTTWEELLLAFAVKRHGIKDWDSVAMELQTRSSLSLLLTSQVCRNKYHDLQRRFTEPDDDDDQTDTIPWLEELRKLRVSELKQELHRYDLSIQTLQLKVKSLEEERERSLKENDDVEPDLENNLEKERSENDKDDDGDAARAPAKSSPTSAAGRENRSFNESSSTANRTEPEPVGTSEFKPDPVQSESKPASEDSCNDSSNTVAKHAAAAAAKVSQEEKKGGDSIGLRDSVGDSKEGVKESSDVQSTASLTRKRRREKEVSGVVSPATIKRVGEKSEPLVGLLDIIIRSHKHSSLFESRLESQKKDEYKNTVRTHMDLATIRTRLKNGSYSSCTTKFYRDLLLLFTNAIVFFPKASIESVTAFELRNLVLEELKKKKPTQRSDSSPDPAPSNPTSVDTKPDLLKPVSLLAKHKSSVPILVCRKRSSISAKTSNAKQTDEKKPNLNPNAPAKNLLNLKEEESPKTNERPVTGTRSTRRNKEEDKGESRTRNDKKKSDVAAVKKQGAADFLRRIKRNSPLKGTTVVETSKSGGGEGSSGGGRRENSKRGEGRKEAPLAKSGSGGGKPRKEESSPLKRGGGRPAKKGTEGGRRKRGREGGVAEVGSKQTRKRSRR